MAACIWRSWGSTASRATSGAYSVMSLESGPFLTMVTLGVAGLSAFPWPTLVGGILPLLAGMLIGNLDREMREFLSRAIPVLIPFFAFALGANLDLGKVWLAGLCRPGAGSGCGRGDRHSAVLCRSPHRRQRRRGRGRSLDRGERRRGSAIIASANPAYCGRRRCRRRSWWLPASWSPRSSCRWSPPGRRAG